MTSLGNIPVFDPRKPPVSAAPASDESGSFFSNLWDDVVETVDGLGPGLKVMAGAVGNDLGKLLTLDFDDGEWQSDDIVDAIWEDYKYVYGPAFSGDVGTTAKRIHENPLGPILDTLAIASAAFTGGGSLALKAGITAQRGGALSAKTIDRLAGMGGLERFGSAVPTRQFMDLPEGDRARIMSIGGEVVHDNKGMTHLFRPKTVELKSGIPGVSDDFFRTELVPLSSNPFRANRQKAMARISNAFPELYWLGAGPRTERIARRRARTTGAAPGSKAAERADLGPLSRIMSGLSGRKIRGNKRVQLGAEFRVVSGQAVKDSAGAVARFANERIAQLTNDIDVTNADAALDSFKELDDMSKRAQNAVDTYVPQINAHEAAGNLADAELAKRDLKTALDKIRENVGTFGRIIGEDGLSPDDIIKRVDERKKAARNKDLIVPQMELMKARAQDLLDNPLDADELELVDELANAYVNASAGTGRSLKAAGVNVGEDRALLPQLVVGRDEAGLDRSAHILPTNISASVMKEMQRKKSPFVTKNEVRPANSKFATGYTYRYGLNFLEPEQVVRTYRAVARFALNKNRFNDLLGRAKVLRAGDTIPKGWTTLDLNTNRRWAQTMDDYNRIVDEEIPMVFGSDNPIVDDLRQQMQTGIMSRFKEMMPEDATQPNIDAVKNRLQLVIPKSAERELFNEFRKSTVAWKRFIQDTTSLWRFTVLNLRPQWLENSVIGSSVLLMASIGPYKALRGIMAANPWGGLNSFGRSVSKLVDDYAGGVRMMGAGRIEPTDSLDGLGHSMYGRALSGMRNSDNKFVSFLGRGIGGPVDAIRWWGKTMGDLNALISDDYPRRALFYELVRPRAKKLIKSERKLGNELTMQEAVYRIMTKDGEVPIQSNQLRVYRVMSEDEWRNAKANGFVQSTGTDSPQGFTYYSSGQPLGSFEVGPGENVRVVSTVVDRDRVDATGGGVVSTEKIPVSEFDFVSDAIGEGQYRKWHDGKPWPEEAEGHVIRVPDPDVVDELTMKTLDDMVDFDDLTDFERNVVRQMLPFWSWIKGSTKVAGRMPIDRPITTALMAAIGREGIKEVERELGEVPEFLQSAIPIGEEEDGRRKVIPSAAQNPFETPIALAESVMGLAARSEVRGTDHPAASLNPFIKAPIEAMANRDFFTGGPVRVPFRERGVETSFLERLAARSAGAFPPVQFAERTALRDTSRDRNALFTPGFEPEAVRFLGGPVRELNLDQARRRARRESRG